MSLLQNLVSYWKMEGNSNDVVDGNNGTDTSITYGTSYGKILQGTLFNGSSSYISIANNANINFLQSSPFTLSVWIKLGATTDQHIIDKQQNVTNEFNYCFIVDGTTQKLAFYVSKQNIAGTGILTNSAVTTGVWYHLVGISDGTNISLYLNGVQQGTTTAISFSGATQCLATLYFGKFYNNTEYFNGDLDEVGIWNRALSSDEVLALYNSGNGLPFPFGNSNFLSFFT